VEDNPEPESAIASNLSFPDLATMSIRQLNPASLFVCLSTNSDDPNG
jgi:hypothetical protein